MSYICTFMAGMSFASGNETSGFLFIFLAIVLS